MKPRLLRKLVLGPLGKVVSIAILRHGSGAVFGLSAQHIIAGT